MSRLSIEFVRTDPHISHHIVTFYCQYINIRLQFKCGIDVVVEIFKSSYLLSDFMIFQDSTNFLDSNSLTNFTLVCKDIISVSYLYQSV